MSWADVLMTAGVFVGGAAPWLEAIVVIPAGIIAGLPPVIAVLAGVTGNLLTVGVAAWFGDRVRSWWLDRREVRRRRADDDLPADPAPTDREWGSSRVKRVAQRWGMPALAVLGPIGLGTQVSAAVAVGMGVTPRAAFVWIGVGTVAWSLVAAVAAVTGMSFLGVGA